MQREARQYCRLFAMVSSMPNHNKSSRKTTSLEYMRRIRLAQEYVAQHLDEPIRLDDVAKASHFSSYHFHRIFHALQGETINEYVSRKRMEKAAKRLAYKSDTSITEVAMMGGFSSSANFSKAFKQYFGISPSDLRKGYALDDNSKIGKLYRKYGKEFNPQELYSQFVTDVVIFEPDELEEMLMNIKVETLQEKPIAYLSSPNGYELDSIFNTWDKLIHWANSRGITDEMQNRFAICHDNPLFTPEDKCRYDAAIVVEPSEEVSRPYTKSTIPAGKYAIAYYKDTAEKINSFMTELCSQWLCQSGYEPDDFPPLFNYLNDSRQDGFVEMNIYIKVKPLSVA